eukprot:scaffold7467_cov187-Amphora_coffeaeformis.AAC.1
MSSQLNDELIHCAWEAEDCGVYNYQSFAKIEAAQVSNKCRLNHRQYAGMCLDELLCTGDASNCQDPTKYADKSPFCNFEYNRYPDTPSGAFWLSGQCTVNGESTCVYSQGACTAAGGTYQTPAQMAYADTCTCNRVKTGACRRGNGDLMCAVSAKACDSTDTYIEWNALNGELDCTLCAGFPKTKRTWVDELDGKVMPLDYDRLPTKPGELNDDNLKIIAIGIGVGVALTALSCFFCGRWSRRSSGKEFDSSNGGTNA